MEFGTIKKAVVDGNVRTLTVEVREHDSTTVDLYIRGGVEYIPQVGDIVHFNSITKEFEVVSRAVSSTAINSDLQPGERETFAESSGSRKAVITQRADGTIELNQGTGFAVEFNALKAAFDQLVTEFNAHVHPAPAGATEKIVVPSTANIDSSKVNKVKL